ncbi:MAG: T9SS type A sorting domain-containing protein [Crocinitomix sp.]|nr:T9SS type A sorting domain-containing protein [Crocinitomix sp.]
MNILKIIVLFIVSASNIASAQEYLPFPTEDVIWSNGLYTVEENEWGGYYYDLYGTSNYCGSGEDTLIGSEAYKIIRFCGGDYKGALRDAGGTVYFVPKDSTDEFVLYDFTTNVGDTVYNIYSEGGLGENPANYKVTSISSIEVEGVTRRVIYLGGGRWIEGIGCEKGFFAEFLDGASEYGKKLYCMSVGDTTFYTESEGVTYTLGSCSLSVGIEEVEKSVQFSVYPNPSKNIVNCSFSFDINIKEVLLTSAEGRVVSINWTHNNDGISFSVSDIPKGIYYVTVIANERVLRKSILVD